MDKTTKVILIIASIMLFLMLFTLGYDLFAKKSPPSNQTSSVTSQLQSMNTARENLSE